MRTGSLAVGLLLAIVAPAAAQHLPTGYSMGIVKPARQALLLVLANSSASFLDDPLSDLGRGSLGASGSARGDGMI